MLVCPGPFVSCPAPVSLRNNATSPHHPLRACDWPAHVYPVVPLTLLFVVSIGLCVPPPSLLPDARLDPREGQRVEGMYSTYRARQSRFPTASSKKPLAGHEKKYEIYNFLRACRSFSDPSVAFRKLPVPSSHHHLTWVTSVPSVPLSRELGSVPNRFCTKPSPPVICSYVSPLLLLSDALLQVGPPLLVHVTTNPGAEYVGVLVRDGTHHLD